LHIPVLRNEVIEYLNIEKGKLFFDGTLGLGGHTKDILESNQNSFVYATDKDYISINKAKTNLKNYKDRIVIYNIDFREIFNKSLPVSKIDGFLFDLGISSYQIDDPERGFSYSRSSFLDMRMNKSQELTASDIVNSYSYTELFNVFKKYGEFNNPRKLTKEIIVARRSQKIKTSSSLKKIIRRIHPKRKSMDPLARVFQALRIEVNQELKGLEDFFLKLIKQMKSFARLVVISFHSLEDRLVKKAFKKSEQQDFFKILNKKPVTASKKELKSNPRARSSKLRAGEKL